MKKLFLIAVLVLLAVGAVVLRRTIKRWDHTHLYNPAADAGAEIADAVKRASIEHKNVMLQIGGNWCKWCFRFNDVVTDNPELNKCLHDNYIVVHVNYSNENMNHKVMAELGYPQKLGFPVSVVLDDKGNRLYTQDSESLGDNHGYSKKKILEFFEAWSPRPRN